MQTLLIMLSECGEEIQMLDLEYEMLERPLHIHQFNVCMLSPRYSILPRNDASGREEVPNINICVGCHCCSIRTRSYPPTWPGRNYTYFAWHVALNCLTWP